MKKILLIIIGLLPAMRIKNILLNTLGCNISLSAHLAPLILTTNSVYVGDQVRIGLLNYINCKRLVLRKKSRIGKLNIISGNISFALASRASIGNMNIFRRAPFPLNQGACKFYMGEGSNCTGWHRYDMTRSIMIGRETVIGGSGTQIWTHGFYHGVGQSKERIRVDGKVRIGDFNYIGTKCIINPGVTTTQEVTIGSGAVVSKSIYEPGIYVTQGLRKLDKTFDESLENLTEDIGHPCHTRVFVKKDA